MSSYVLAKALDPPPQSVNDIVREKRDISVDTARRLAAYFNTSPELGLGLQVDSELEVERDRVCDAEIKKMVPSLTMD